jgi:hypothetical protein
MLFFVLNIRIPLTVRIFPGRSDFSAYTPGRIERLGREKNILNKKAVLKAAF